MTKVFVAVPMSAAKDCRGEDYYNDFKAHLPAICDALKARNGIISTFCAPLDDEAVQFLSPAEALVADMNQVESSAFLINIYPALMNGDRYAKPSSSLVEFGAARMNGLPCIHFVENLDYFEEDLQKKMREDSVFLFNDMSQIVRVIEDGTLDPIFSGFEDRIANIVDLRL